MQHRLENIEKTMRERRKKKTAQAERENKRERERSKVSKDVKKQ